MAEPFVPIEDLAKHFAVSISTIRAWVRQGHIPKSTYIKIGNTYRFNMTAVTAALTTEAEEVAHNELPAAPTEVQLEFDFNADDDV
jgi:excisionase family DNA binding protein|tara:strand:+ start:929 stop:1186 length:258 start_codon:yes stop_codon:yes gene_type:complete